MPEETRSQFFYDKGEIVAARGCTCTVIQYICHALPKCQSVSPIFIRTWPAVKCCKSVLLRLILVAIAATEVQHHILSASRSFKVWAEMTRDQKTNRDVVKEWEKDKFSPIFWQFLPIYGVKWITAAIIFVLFGELSAIFIRLVRRSCLDDLRWLLT